MPREGEAHEAGELSVPVGTGRATALLLCTLADLPSTPAPIAEEAAERARVIEQQLPVPAPGQHSYPPVQLDTYAAVAVAGLLQLMAEMPSTPPLVGDDARERAEEFWGLLDM